VDPAPKDALVVAFGEVVAALGCSKRAEIVDVLTQGERSVSEIARQIGQNLPNTSHHLRTLARAGLVHTRRERTRIYYALSSDRVERLWAAVRAVAEERVAGHPPPV
jgi:DNA-binding transcriptional ArsR family regulator